MKHNRSKYESRLTGALWLVAAQAIVLLLGYVSHIWISRALGPAPYGLYGVVLSLQTIVGMILTLGVPIGVSRFVAQDEEHAPSILRQALKIQVVLAFSIALLTLLAAPLLAHLLNDSSLTNLIRFSALVLFLQAFYPLYVQYVSGRHQFRRQAALTSLYAVFKLAAAIVLMYVIGVYGAIAGFAVGGLFATAIGWWWTRHDSSPPKHLAVKSFLAFAGTYVFILVGLQLLISLDLFLVKALLQDDTITGYYNAAVTLSRIPYLLLQGISFVLLPSVSSLTKPGSTHDRAAAFIRDTLRYLIAIIVPSAALAAATSKSLIILFFSDRYTPGAAALTILMVGLSALAFYLLLTNIVAGAGRAKVVLLLTLVMLAISAALGYVLIPRFQLLGAAWQTTITGLIGLIFLSAYTFRTFRIPIPWRSTTNICLATAVAISLTYFWKASVILLIPQYLIVLVVYLLALIALGEVTSKDMGLLRRIIPLPHA